MRRLQLCGGKSFGASPTDVLRVGAGIGFANDTEVVAGVAPFCQKVCKVFERIGLGLEFGWRLIFLGGRKRLAGVPGGILRGRFVKG
jgi:hypothetical protein